MFAVTLFCFGTCLAQTTHEGVTPLPNVIFILADDLGYGDLSCYNDEAKVQTPHLDKLASQGMRFTDAHSASTVCTPTRYSLLTGRMCFRTGYRGVFTGVGGPCLIEPERLTLPELFKNSGYTTAMFGKWHVGLTAYDSNGDPIHRGGLESVEKIDYSRPFDGGPIDHGFDHFYGTVCCPTTDWLYAYVEDDRVPVPPRQNIDKSRYPQNQYTRDFRNGLAADNFDASEVDLVFLEKSRSFIRKHVKLRPTKPFFLFHSMQAVHLPSIPAKRFRGSTTAGPHGDFIHEMDWIVGQLMKDLDTLGIADNTVVMFGSDNGPEVPTVIAMRRDHQHDGARPWRGVKRDQWEGGHRTPFIVRWPNRVAKRSMSNQLLSLTDVFATCAAIIGTDVPNEAAEDSYNMFPAFLDEARAPIRDHMLSQTISNALAIRQGRWKYLDHRGSGGNNYNRGGQWGMKQYALPEANPDAPGQLYNLIDDPGETENLYSQHSDVANRLKTLLEQLKESGRSAPEG
ncbi:MAG: sulfatase-like hydrolase/transferase [Planctomycetota bacterium]